MAIKKLGPKATKKLDKKVIKFFNKNVVKRKLISGRTTWRHKGHIYDVIFNRVDL